VEGARPKDDGKQLSIPRLYVGKNFLKEINNNLKMNLYNTIFKDHIEWIKFKINYIFFFGMGRQIGSVN